jgi:O-succinylbenzoate synthase
MIVSKIELYQLRMPLQTPFETSFGRIEERECILLEAHADGLVGYGECVADRDPGYSYETTGTAWHILRDFLIPGILNKEIQSPEDVQTHMEHVRGHPLAKAGLEMVFWDLQGKNSGQNLQEMIGGQGDRVQVGVSVGIQESPDALIHVVDDYLSQGYRRVKIKIKPGRDVSDARSVRQAFPDLGLQVDANSAYNLESAVELLPLDELNLLMIEQPLAEDDLWDHSRLQAKFSTPICLDESIVSLRHARQALDMKSCQVVNIKAGRVGGLSQAIAIHDLCQAHNIPVWCGGMLETGVGRAANLALSSLPGFAYPGDISATDRYYANDITQERFVLNSDSTISIPMPPGLGISIDHQALQKATINRLTVS